MRVNLTEFLALPREAQAQVTHLDLSLADDPKPWRNPRCGDAEEYEGEAASRGLTETGYLP